MFYQVICKATDAAYENLHHYIMPSSGQKNLLMQDSLLTQDFLLMCCVLPGDLQSNRCGV